MPQAKPSTLTFTSLNGNPFKALAHAIHAADVERAKNLRKTQAARAANQSRKLVAAFRRLYIERTGPMSVDEAEKVVARLRAKRDYSTLAEQIAYAAAVKEVKS